MVKISICGMCKHFGGDTSTFSCPAFPDGRSYNDCFPCTDEECGNGVHFEPKEDCADICDEEFYKQFAHHKE